MLKPNHITAARGLLRWSQEDLAKKSGVSGRTINFIENEKQNASQETLLAIEMAFGRSGVIFKNNGVLLEDRSLQVIDGANALSRLFDDIEFSLLGNGEVLIDGADESLTPPVIVEKVAKLRKSGMGMRHMVKEGDRYLRGPLHEYRWIPKKYFINQAMFIYANSVAILTYNQSILIHRDGHLTDFLRNKYDLLWSLLQQPDYSEATDVYDV